MNYWIFDLVKAHQQEMHRSAARTYLPRQSRIRMSLLWELFLNFLGDALINLGEKVKSLAACAKLSQGRA